jgi:hypothetical protein
VAKVFVLVGDDQVPVSPRDVLAAVQAGGFAAAAERYALSESTLRKFLSENHYVAVRQVSFQKEGVPVEALNEIERARTTDSEETQISPEALSMALRAAHAQGVADRAE